MSEDEKAYYKEKSKGRESGGVSGNRSVVYTFPERQETQQKRADKFMCRRIQELSQTVPLMTGN